LEADEAEEGHWPTNKEGGPDQQPVQKVLSPCWMTVSHCGGVLQVRYIRLSQCFRVVEAIIAFPAQKCTVTVQQINVTAVFKYARKYLFCYYSTHTSASVVTLGG
jgi:hypothetical protein